MTNAGFESPVVSVFIDDIKIMASKESRIIECIKAKLISIFLMADMGLISFCLSLKVEQNWEKKTIKLSQPAYIDKVFIKFYLNKAHPINILIKKSALLQPRTNGEALIFKRE